MNEETVRPCRPRHGGKPVIAHGKFSCQGCKHGKLTWSITFHYLTWMGRIDGGVVRDEAAVVDVGEIAFDSTELYLDIGKLMAWIIGHRPVGWRGNKGFISLWIEIPILSRIQSLDGSRLSCKGIDAL